MPGGSAQPVAEVEVPEIGLVARAEVEPAKKLAGGGGLGRPGAESVESVIDAQMKGDGVIPDLFARGRPAAGEVAHDLGVTVEVEEVVHVVLGELAQDQPRCFQGDMYVLPSHRARVCGKQSREGREELPGKCHMRSREQSGFVVRYTIRKAIAAYSTLAPMANISQKVRRDGEGSYWVSPEANGLCWRSCGEGDSSGRGPDRSAGPDRSTAAGGPGGGRDRRLGRPRARDRGRPRPRRVHGGAGRPFGRALPAGGGAADGADRFARARSRVRCHRRGRRRHPG